ncbi:glycogen debranching N-terminal domain-containing protein [Micromonospora radicis]|uniref:Amylo-alpha-1,6-glucosidase n=1 Tax=Micromonospora radicis TaxID=1894971 RepID=A0A418MMM1_9ACTN|nr:glycogen debranching N-terminal domain-containing protein [Micromonospora radicis]RIV29825.1 amylo-alpha-1,6-glucosidase [Micromonospora radicis]
MVERLNGFFSDLTTSSVGRLPTTPTGLLRFDFVAAECETTTWFVRLDNGRASARRDGDRADCRVEMRPDAFERLLAGDDQIVAMLFRGVVSIEGELALLLLFQRLLPLPADSGAVTSADWPTTDNTLSFTGLYEASRVFAGNMFMISEPNGNVQSDPDTPLGLYFFDTRFLSTWRLTIDDEPPSVLSQTAVHTWEAKFGLVPGQPTHYVNATTSLLRHRLVGHEFEEEITLLNHVPEPVRHTLRLEIAADFAEVPEIWESRRQLRPVTATIDEGALRLHYRRQTLHRETVVTTSAPGRFSATGLTFTITLAAHGSWTTRLRVLPLVRDLRRRDLRERLNSSTGRSRTYFAEDLASMIARAPLLSATHRPLQETYQRCIHDMAALHYPGLNYREGLPATGLPWSMTLLSRESLLSSFQALPFIPERAARTMRILSLTQGSREDPFRGEQPGKILQECRYGDSAGFNDTPESANFNAVDTTALFVILLDEYERWTGDASLVRQYEFQVRKAIDWLDWSADPESTGYVWTVRHRTRSTPVSGSWRSSANSTYYADGRSAGFPQANCEVQGYTYDAKLRAARLARSFWQDPEWASQLERAAADLRQRFDRDFWLPDRGHYAVALEADGRPVDGLTSTIGQLFWSGIVRPERAEQVVEHLFGPGLWSGWGIRTSTATETRYSPLGRHCGAVWPWDNSIVAWGLSRAGFREEAARIAVAMLEAAQHFQGRLPAYLTGYPRALTHVPVPHGLTDSPYAPSAGTPLLLLRALLGLEPYDDHLAVNAGVPEQLGQIELLDIRGRWGYADALGRGRPFRPRGRV